MSTATFQDAIILFFIKYPEPGTVKTRLAAAIGPEEAAALYRRFILDILAKLQSSDFPFRICFSPGEKRKQLEEWLGPALVYFPQRGTDLGERMKTAFLDAFEEGYKRVSLIGSDFPDLPSSILTEALDSLHHHDTVIGPAFDGGYYLIGFRDDTFNPAAFEKIEWGTEQVFRKTMAVFNKNETKAYILPAWNDVDTIEDLKQLMNRSGNTGLSNSRTLSYLSGLKI